MGTDHQDIDVSCFSEKAGIALGFGYSVDENTAEDEQIANGIEESFWENHYEFEPGIDKAKKLLADNTYSSLRDALKEVFGHFQLTFVIDGVEEAHSCMINPDEIVYRLLENE